MVLAWVRFVAMETLFTERRGVVSGQVVAWDEPIPAEVALLSALG